MSRNFEILHRSAVRPDLFFPAAVRTTDAAESAEPPKRRALSDDEITKLVQRLFGSSAARSPTVVAFCGLDQGAGCSWVCARTSEALAENVSGRVCVVDANLRSPSLHAYFNAAPLPGFAEAMRDSAPIRNFIHGTQHSHLWLMTSGEAAGAPNGSLNPEKLCARFAELRAEFDHVLVDTPSMNTYSDAVALGRVTDGVVLVVESNSTRREVARAAKESLDAAKIPILGAVLNRRTYPIPKALYERM